MKTEKTRSFESYEITVSRTAGTYYLAIAELYLVVSDTNIERGLKQLENDFDKLHTTLRESGQSAWLPTAQNKTSINQRELKNFLVKSIIVSGAVLFIIGASVTIVTTKAAQFSLVKLLTTQAKMASHITERWTNTDEQTKKFVLAEFETHLHQIQPFIDLIKTSLSTEATYDNDLK